MQLYQLQTAANMIDLNNAIIILAVVIATGLGTTAATLFSTFKWYLPNVFRRRDEQRQVEIDALKKELESKHAAEAVDIERERLLPQLVEQNRVMSNTTITLAQSFNTTMHQRTEQDAITAAALNANTKQLTDHSARLDETTEQLEAVALKVDRLHDRLINVFPRDKSIDDLFGELRQVVAATKQVVHEHTGDTKPVVPIQADITIHTPKDEPPPDELKTA